ncbi:MAG: sodium:proton exchanger, partial [Candidatus Aenigmatarchaeota archaeon]
MVASPLFDIGLIIIVSTFFAYLARILRQPFLVAYVLAGFVIGPSGLGLITNTSEIATLSELGIAFLLFTVGLEIDLRKLKHVGFISIGGGILQVILTFITGFFVAQWIGFDLFPSIYMGLLTAFSSTMIVTKLLVDRYEINTLHGRIMLGVLLIQDLIIITILPILTNTATSISMEFL